ncbi:DUF4382 domain-containing protein [Gaetbulibacter aestuarii]|uniref:DUF4382 domain-containing protein n=1 Tax=Gaetbulibacter aestuarii TaxID=1502358 RepID=A0ABW7MXY6_9FLAO
MNLKKLRTYGLFCLTLIVFAFAQSCSNNNDTASRLQLKMVDAPGDYQEVNVEITDIQYNTTDSEAGWKSFTPASGYPINVDLTQLVAGNSLILADQIIPAGMMHQIRLVLGDNNTLKLEGIDELIPLDTPSALQSGLKLNLNTKLEGGFTYTFILDWVVSESVVEAGTTGMYNLKPVIKVNAEVNSGSISGLILDDAQNALDNVTVNLYDSNNEKVTDTMTGAQGNFLFQGISEGSYTIKVNENGYDEFTIEVEVSVGEVTDAGTLSLTPTP